MDSDQSDSESTLLKKDIFGFSIVKVYNLVRENVALILHLSHNMRFPTMWHVQPAKPQISLRICAV